MNELSFGTLVKLALFGVVLFATFLARAYGADFYVTSVIKDFPMKSGETVYTDYYVNAGSENGLKKGMVLEALRKLPAYDNINSKILGDTEIPIAKLKIIHVDKGVAIARLVKLYEREATPVTGMDGVVIGDMVQVSEK